MGARHGSGVRSALERMRRQLGRRRARRFSAVAWPGGIDLVEYAEEREHATVVRHTRRLGPLGTAEELAASLAEMVETQGGRGSTLALGLRGFGTVHRIITLPVAAPELLLPIVVRDLQRFEPTLRDPVAGFVSLRRIPGDAAPKQDLLAAAVPEPVVEVLQRVLMQRQVTLGHLTVLPRAVQRVYEAFNDSSEPAVVAWVLPGSPVVAAFDSGELRLLRDPPIGADPESEETVPVAVQLIDRAVLFLRQQFGGLPVRRLLVAATPEHEQMLRDSIPEGWALEVEPLGGEAGAPGALAALGVALDAAEPDGLDLRPDHPLRAGGAVDSEPQKSWRLAAAIVLILGLAWAATGLYRELTAGREVRSTEQSAAASAASISGLLPTVRQREAHHQRLRLLERVHQGSREVGALLRQIDRTTPPSVRIDSLRVADAGDGNGWSVLLTGTSTGWTSAEAMQSVNEVYRGVQQRLPLTEFALDRLESFPPATEAGSIAVRFGMSFIVGLE